jgi:hypothetical protein
MDMQAPRWKQWNTRLSLTIKCAALLMLFLLSVLVVACSSGGANTSNANLGNPPVTVTINLGNNNLSPTPTLSPYWCGAWATNTSPAFNATSEVGVYAKFVQNNNGNPAGIGGATAQATVMWPDGTAQTLPPTTTTPDGLAVFFVPARGDAVNKITYITVTFTQPNGGPGCTVGIDRAAYFTLIATSPTPTKGTPPPGGKGPTGTPTGTPGKTG